MTTELTTDETADGTAADPTRAAETAAIETAAIETAAVVTAAVAVERKLEAILMVADEPQSLISLATTVGEPVATVRKAIEALVADFDGVGGGGGASAGGGVRRGFELREVGGGWRFYVRAEFDDVVRDFVLTENPSKLSQAALETLAVIAYKQPISRGAIASIRAVNVDSVVRTLLGRGLITEAYTDSETGAIHYATTDLMLTQLGINSIDDLPLISPLLSDGSDGFDEQR